MTSELVFDASEIFRLSAQMANAAPTIAKHSRIGIERAVVEVQRDAMALVVVDVGHLRRSITNRVDSPFLGHVGSNLIYARTVEEGWPPNYRWIPKGKLLPWMRKHGIPASAEYFIRRKIYREGLAARPYLVPALEHNRAAFYREMANRMRDAATEITARRAA